MVNYGKYKWQTFKEVERKRFALAKAIVDKEMFSSMNDEGRDFKFVGIYAKNRAEWIITDLALVSTGIVSVSLYDTLGAEATEFIVGQTELPTLFTSQDKIAVIAKLKNDGMIQTVENVVSFDPLEEGDKDIAAEAGINLFTFEELIQYGEGIDVELTPPTKDDIYTFCYTSGTTGVPKGAMTTHMNIVADAYAC